MEYPPRKPVRTIDLTKKPNESEFDYHKRIIYGKLVDKTLSDIDYTELAELVYGKPYASDVARRMFYGSRKTLDLVENSKAGSIENAELLTEIDDKMIELRKERQKFFDQRTAFNKVVRERARQEELNEIIVNTIREGELSGKLAEMKYDGNEVEPSDNDLLVSLNDLHYGATYSNYWGEYNSEICAQRMGEYLDRVIHIGKVHKSESCIVWQNGDSISGSIHRSLQITNKENVIEQVMGVSELISAFIAELSKHFKTVKLVSVAGNHSRVEPDKEKALIDERMDDLVEWYVEARLQNFENVVIGAGEKIDPTMYLIDVRGKNYVGVHGDFDGSESKIQALQTMVGKPVYALLLGHKHRNMTDRVQGIKTVMAGSFLGMDDFCVQKRIYGKPEQMVCVCNDDGILCHYDILL